MRFETQPRAGPGGTIAASDARAGGVVHRARALANCFRALHRYSPRRFPTSSSGCEPSTSAAGAGRAAVIRMEQRVITPAYAQAGGAGGGDIFLQLVPFILIFVIMWFLIIRPQQKRVKAHQEMVKGLRRGDQIVTSGGILGKISKVVDDAEIEVEIAEGVRVRIVRAMVTDVRSKTEPVKLDK